MWRTQIFKLLLYFFRFWTRTQFLTMFGSLGVFSLRLLKVCSHGDTPSSAISRIPTCVCRKQNNSSRDSHQPWDRGGNDLQTTSGSMIFIIWAITSKYDMVSPSMHRQAPCPVLPKETHAIHDPGHQRPAPGSNHSIQHAVHSRGPSPCQPASSRTTSKKVCKKDKNHIFLFYIWKDFSCHRVCRDYEKLNLIPDSFSFTYSVNKIIMEYITHAGSELGYRWVSGVRS